MTNALGLREHPGGTCVSPIYYEVAPTNGKSCLSGWGNIGAGYCKKKKGPGIISRHEGTKKPGHHTRLMCI